MNEIIFGIILTIVAGMLRRYEYSITAIVTIILIALCGFWGVQCFINLGANTVHYGMLIALRTDDGKYVMTNVYGKSYLAGSAEQIGPWEIFEIVDADDPYNYPPNRVVRYGDTIALRSVENNNFVRSASDIQNHLIADAPSVKPWEIFVLHHPNNDFWNQIRARLKYGKPFALQAHFGHYVSYTSNGDLKSVETTIQARETFVCIDPSRPK